MPSGGRFSILGLAPYVVLALVSLPLVILFGWLLYSSFFPRVEGLTPIGDFSLDNWRFLWNPNSVQQLAGRSIWALTLNTFIFAISVSLIVVLVSSMAGYALSRLAFPGRRTFLSGVLILHSFPSVTLLIATFIVLRQIGLFDQLVGVILVKAAFEIPFGVWIMKGFFDTVPWELEMAALVDGAGRLRTWWRVMMPLVKPGILALGLLSFVTGWNEFLLPFIFMPSGSQEVLSTLVRSILGEGRFVDYGLLTAVGLYYVAPILVLFVLAQDRLMRIYGGGVKG
jgi:inositol-phosphate transport system permease protein